MDKVYIIESYSGTQYDVHSFIVAICDTPEAADRMKNRYVAEVKEYQSRYTPEQCNKLDKDSQEEEIASKSLQEYWEWKYSEQQTASIQVTVKEQYVNKLLYSFE